MDHVLTLIDGSCIDLDVNGLMSRGFIVVCIDEDGSMSCHWYMIHIWRWINVGSFIYDAYLDWCKDDSLLSCHGYTNGWTPKWTPYGERPHGKMLCDELQSCPLMVKSLTGRHFVVELS